VADTTPDLIYMRERRLPYETFDADNHLYENQDALTKFIPREYQGVMKYVEVGGRTKLAIRDHISEYIPNPTFNRVAVPGGWGNTAANRGHGGVGGHTGVKPRVMPGIDAFFDPEPRLALMKDMGIDRTLLWPTLASVVEERVADDPDIAVTIVHALNQWMHEHWSYVYSDAIFSTPIISLAAGNDTAIEELHYVHERGAKIFLMRVAPVPTWTFPKATLVGLGVNVPGVTPIPDKATSTVDADPLTVSDNSPLLVPVPVGANLTPKVEAWLGARVNGKVNPV